MIEFGFAGSDVLAVKRVIANGSHSMLMIIDGASCNAHIPAIVCGCATAFYV